jgi:hypothetical protein
MVLIEHLQELRMVKIGDPHMSGLAAVRKSP